MHVHQQMLSSKSLEAPRDCEIPVSLRRQGLTLGRKEFLQDKWVCGEPSGRVWGPFSREEILAGRDRGEMSGNVRVVPLSWMMEWSATIETMNRALEDVSRDHRHSNGRERTVSFTRVLPGLHE